MNRDDEFHFEGLEYPLPAEEPKAQQPRGPAHPSKARWTEPPVSLEAVVANSYPNPGDHAYNTYVGVSLPQGRVYEGEDLAGHALKNCYFDVVQNTQGVLLAAVFKVPNSQGIFEDLVLRNAPITSGFSLIGTPADEVIAVPDYPSGLVIHYLTNICVVVSHSVQNLPDVCRAIADFSPAANIILAMGNRRPADVAVTKTLMLSLSDCPNVRIAMPTGLLNFHSLYKLSGDTAVKRALAQADVVPESWKVKAVEPEFPDVIAWPAPVHPGGLIGSVCGHIAKHAALNFSSICAIALWSVSTHFSKRARFSPILALLSLTKRCGKTSTLAVITPLVRRALTTSDISAAGMYHACSLDVALMTDEFDQWGGRQGANVIGLFNAGTSRAASAIRRVIGGKLKLFDVFGPKCLCAIGVLPGTVGDRSITIPLIRKLRTENVVHYSPSDNDTATMLRAQLESLAIDYADQVATAMPAIPDLGNDRAVDNWRPLFSVAACAGPLWLENASEAALALTQDEDEVPTVMEEFICDLAEIYRASEDGFVTSAELIRELCKDPEKAWATFTHNRNIGFHDLAGLMRRLKLYPEQRHRDGQNLKGYTLRDLDDLFERYAPM